MGFDRKKITKKLGELLVERGADLNLQDGYSRTPIYHWPELAEIVKKLEAERKSKAANLEQGAKPLGSASGSP